MMDECKGEARRSRSKSVREMRWLQRKWQPTATTPLQQRRGAGKDIVPPHPGALVPNAL